MNKGFIILALISALFWQCSEVKEPSPVNFGVDYFPLQTGTYRIYQVYGAIKSFDGDSIEFSYLLKESVVDSFQNLEGGISYELERQKKYNENDPWETDSIWTARVDDKTAVRIEHNVPIVSLTFPLVESKKWDGNKLNGKGEKMFEMSNIGQPFSDSFGSFEQTVLVIQEYLPDPIVNDILKKELYAKSIGLVYKEIIILVHEQKIENYVPETSLDYYQHLIDYGKE